MNRFRPAVGRRWLRWPALLAAVSALLATVRSTSAQVPHFQGITAERPTGSAAIEPRGLVLAWDMETLTPDGLLRDFSGRGHHGELGEALLARGPLGGAQAFASVAQRIHIAEHADLALDGPLTIAAWMRVDSLGLHQHVLACDDQWAFWITPDDRYRLGDTRGGGVSTVPGSVRPGRWTSVVLVMGGTVGDPIDADLVTIWVDGRPAVADAHLRNEAAQAARRWSPGELYPTDACYAGFESHQGNEVHQTMPFVGAIDELLVFDRAWTPSEVAAFAARFGPEESAVRETGERFFQAMAARDTVQLAALSHPGLTLVATVPGPDSSTVRVSTRAQFFTQIANAARVPIERMWDPEVRVRHDIATIWTPYDLHWDDTYSHCGIDTFQLVRERGRWRVLTILYTVERAPQRCEPNPAGPPG
ncbi:MAG: LamG-like jellyroll fold domain-containing protein [Gemmatimonadota bacterium]